MTRRHLPIAVFAASAFAIAWAAGAPVWLAVVCAVAGGGVAWAAGRTP